MKNSQIREQQLETSEPEALKPIEDRDLTTIYSAISHCFFRKH